MLLGTTPRSSPSIWTGYFGGSALLILSVLFRLISYPIQTSDYIYFVSKWFVVLQEHPGLTAFTQRFSDYAPLYLYLLKLLTFIPVSSLYSTKTMSVLFDVLIAYITYRLIKYTTKENYPKEKLFFIFAVMFSIPTLVLNGATWGQSDSIYAAGVVLCLYFIIRDMPLSAVVSLSVALSCKLQAIFFLPVLIGYCLRKESSAGYLLAIPCIYFLSIIPARLGGGSLGDLLLVYARQSSEYTSLSVSAQNIFAILHADIFGLSEQTLFAAGLVVAILCALIITVYVYLKKEMNVPTLVLISTLCVAVLPYLLPRMHERYFYLADLFSVIYVFYRPSRWFIPVFIVGASLVAYMPYLSQVSWFAGLHPDLRIPSVMMLIAIGILYVDLVFIKHSSDYDIVER